MELIENPTCDLCQQPLSDLEVLRGLFILKPCIICRTCKKRFERITGLKCRQCGRDVAEVDDNQCLDCRVWMKRTNGQIKHVSLYHYNEIMQHYFKYYKFQGGYHLSQLFCSEIQRTIRKMNVEVVVPIPLSDVKYSARGFNQVEAWLGTDYQQLLKRVHQTDSQSKRTKWERINSSNPFSVSTHQPYPKECRICLVDDIYTTGTTIRQAYEVIRQAGYRNICSLSLVHA
ncbi:putative ComF operon protein 3 [Weissella viridescens]|uniref:ComF family protein n=3 Tax=Weissella viridescens TaxID=1629 RepID=A0A0R2H763_WEIVI|nr:hypothetical protein IV50_GL001452 [Weissella viridescens]SOB43862.1 putative ComF operon protein 3 [Weissella viridescens]